MVSGFEGNKAETKAMLPVIEVFMAAQDLPDVTVRPSQIGAGGSPRTLPIRNGSQPSGIDSSMSQSTRFTPRRSS
jgi:hypothetical protein